METQILFEPRLYTVRELGTVDLPSGEHTRVGVFMFEGEEEKQVGEYLRNLGGTGPFFPFLQGGVEYALYSPNYTTTSVMRLPDCEKIASEPDDPMGIGYCPMEFCVPTTPKKRSEIYGLPYEDQVRGLWGVVSGCYWGAEWYSPIQFLDLSEIEKGKVSRDDRFGGLQAPRSLPLKDALDLWCYTDKSPTLSILASTPVNLTESMEVDPLDLAKEILTELDPVKDHSRRVSILESKINWLLRWHKKG